jgi:hypothetical protein
LLRFCNNLIGLSLSLIEQSLALGIGFALKNRDEF